MEKSFLDANRGSALNKVKQGTGNGTGYVESPLKQSMSAVQNDQPTVVLRKNNTQPTNSNQLPSAGQIYTQIGSMYRSGKTAEATKYMQDFMGFTSTPGNPYYNPYTAPQNSTALVTLSRLTGNNYTNGITQDDINSLWQYADTTNLGVDGAYKNSGTNQQRLAYWLNKLQIDEDTTQAAESELMSMSSKISYLVQRGYSDQAIAAKISMDDYPQLKKAQEANAVNGKMPNFNRGINYYGDDTISGMIYAARNSKDYNGLESVIGYYSGTGNSYVPDPWSEAARDYTNKGYYPTAFGASDTTEMNTFCQKYGVTGFDREWLDNHQAELLANKKKNDSGRSDWDIANDAVDNYEAATKELEKLKASCEDRIRNGASYADVVTYVEKAIMKEGASGSYPTLYKMETARQNGSSIPLSDSVEFALPYFTGATKHFGVDKGERYSPRYGNDRNRNGVIEDDELSGTFWLSGAYDAYQDELEANAQEERKTLFGEAVALSEDSKDTNVDLIEDNIRYAWALEKGYLDEKGNYVGKPEEWITQAQLNEYAKEKNLFIDGTNITNQEELFVAANKYADDLRVQKEKERKQAELDEARAVPFNPNFSARSLVDGVNNGDKAAIDSYTSYQNAIIRELNGDIANDSNAKTALVKYKYLFGGVVTDGNPDPTELFSAIGGEVVYDERERALGEYAGKAIAEVDDAARDGIISRNEQVKYLTDIMAAIETYGGSDAFRMAVESGDANARAIVDSLNETIKTNAETVEQEKKNTSIQYAQTAWQSFNSDSEDDDDKNALIRGSIDSIDISGIYDKGYDNAIKNVANNIEAYYGAAWETVGYGAEETQYQRLSNAEINLKTAAEYSAYIAVDRMMKVAKGANISFDEALRANGYESAEQYVKEATDKAIQTVSDEYEIIKGAKDAYAKTEELKSSAKAIRGDYVNGVDSSEIVGTGEGGKWLGTWYGIGSGARQFALSTTEIGYAFLRNDKQTVEKLLRNYGTRDAAKQLIQEKINSISNDALRESLQYKLDTYSGDIYDFDFDFVTASLQSSMANQREALQKFNMECAGELTPEAYEFMKNVAVVTNSTLISTETMLAATAMSAMGMSASVALTAANVIFMGSYEAAPVINARMDAGDSKANAIAIGMTVGAINGIVESALTTILVAPVNWAGGINISANIAEKTAGFSKLLGQMTASKAGQLGVSEKVQPWIASLVSGGTKKLLGLAESAIEEPLEEGVQNVISQFGSKIGMDTGERLINWDEALGEMGTTFDNTLLSWIGQGMGQYGVTVLNQSVMLAQQSKQAASEAVRLANEANSLNEQVKSLNAEAEAARTSGDNTRADELVANAEELTKQASEANKKAIEAEETSRLLAEKRKFNGVLKPFVVKWYQANKVAQSTAQQIVGTNERAEEAVNAYDAKADTQIAQETNTAEQVAEQSAEKTWGELLQDYSRYAEVEKEMIFEEIDAVNNSAEVAQANVDIEDAKAVQADAEAKLSIANSNNAQAETEFNEINELWEVVSDEFENQGKTDKKTTKEYAETAKAVGAARAVLDTAKANLEAARNAVEQAKQAVEAAYEAKSNTIKGILDPIRSTLQDRVNAIRDKAIAELEAEKEFNRQILKDNAKASNEHLLNEIRTVYGDFWAELAEAKGKISSEKILSNYADVVIDAKEQLTNMAREAFLGWKISFDNNIKGAGEFNENNHTITFRTDLSVGEMWNYLVGHEFTHIAKFYQNNTGKTEEGLTAFGVLGNAVIKALWKSTDSAEYKEAEAKVKKEYGEDISDELLQEEMIAEGVAQILSNDEFGFGEQSDSALFARFIANKGGFDFGKNFYEFLRKQAAYIKESGAKNGFFKRTFDSKKEQYANVVNAFADALKEAADYNNKLYREKHGEWSANTQKGTEKSITAEQNTEQNTTEIESQTEETVVSNETSVPVDGISDDSNPLSTTVSELFGEDVETETPAKTPAEEVEQTAQTDKPNETEAVSDAVLETAVNKGIATVLDENDRLNALRAIKKGQFGKDLTTYDIENLVAMVKDGLLKESDINLVATWADGIDLAIETEAPKVETPKNDYDLTERLLLTDENGKKINMGSKRIAPYYNTHWNEFKYARDAANVLLDDMQDYMPPESYAFKGGVGENYTEVRRVNGSSTPVISDLLTHFRSNKEKGTAADQAKVSLAEFIKAYDTSTPLRNTAAMKWIEVAVDGVLRNGYTTIRGQNIAANQEYRQLSNADNNIRNSLFWRSGLTGQQTFLEAIDYAIQDAVAKGDTSLAKKLVGRMLSMVNRSDALRANSNTPTNTLRLLAEKVGTHLYERVAVDRTAADVVTARNSRAVFTNRIDADNFDKTMSSLARTVLLRTSTTEADMVEDGINYYDFFYDYLTHTDNQLNPAYKGTVDKFRAAFTGDARKTLDSIDAARNQLTNWFTSQSVDRMLAQIQSVSEYNQDKNSKNSLMREFVRGMIDRTEAARVADELYSYLKGERTGRLHKVARASAYTAKIADTWWSGNERIDIHHTRMAGLTAKQIAEKHNIYSDKETQNLVDAYFVAREALDRYNNEKDPFDGDTDLTDVFNSNLAMNKDQCERTVADIEANHPNIAAYCNEFYGFWDDFMRNVVVASGAININDYEKMAAEHPHYAPLRRKDGTYKLVEATGHSNEKVVSPSEMMYKMASQFASEAAAHTILSEFDKMFTDVKGMGKLASRYTDKDITRTLPDGTVEEGMLDAVPRGALVLNKPDGSKVYYQVADETLRDVLAGHFGNPIASNRFMRFSANCTRWMAGLTTGINIIFAGKNAIRDIQHSINYGSHSVSYFDGLVRWLAALGDVAGYEFSQTGLGQRLGLNLGSEQIRDYTAMGGSGWQRVSIDTEVGERAWRNATFAQKPGVGRAIAREAGRFVTLQHAKDFSEFINGIIETSSRFVEYKYGENATGSDSILANRKARGQAVTEESKLNAYMASMEATVDFAQKGNSVAIQLARTFIPFFGAATQGVAQDFRIITDPAERSRLAPRLAKNIINNAIVGAMSAASFMLFNALKGNLGEAPDDEEDFAQLYLDLQDSLKQQYILIPGLKMDGARDVIRIPLTQGTWSQLAYEFGRKAVEEAFTGNREDIVHDGFASDLVQTVVQSTIGTFADMTPIFAPLIQVGSNKNWYGGDIVSSSLQRYERVQQYSDTTPSFFINASIAFDKIADWIGLDQDALFRKAMTSPVALEYITKQYTGVLGQTIPAMLSPDKATHEIHPLSSLGNVLKNAWTLDMDASTDIGNEYNDGVSLISSIAKSEGKRLGSLDGRMSDAEVTQSVLAAQNLNKILIDDATILNGYYKQIASIQRDASISQLERESKVEALQRKCNDLEKKDLRLINEFKYKYCGGDILSQLVASYSGKRVRDITQQESMIYNLPMEHQVAYNNGESYMNTAVDMYERYAQSNDGKYSETMVPHYTYKFSSEGKQIEVPEDRRAEYEAIYDNAYKERAAEVEFDLRYSDDPVKDWAKVHEYAYSTAKKWWLNEINP